MVAINLYSEKRDATIKGGGDKWLLFSIANVMCDPGFFYLLELTGT